jgi:hypothetical protein
MKETWMAAFPAEIIVCDTDGIILEMNETAVGLYRKEGGAALIGHNVFDHHPQSIKEHVKTIATRQEKVIYTTEKGGRKTLVCIAPWFNEKNYAGFVLMTLGLPEKMENILKG